MSFKGRRNAYLCPVCGMYTITIDVGDGVTPFLLDCRGPKPGCPGMARSQMYPAEPWPEWIPAPAWEWYKPTEKQIRRPKRRDPATADHVERGGLLLRARTSAA